ncbi:MAG: sulfite exporter TauE/SafE family protein [Candidatus Aquicultor sp.]|nr:sulfite exporter TauE/SafE family protein [Candidatus Aquicultor sp.]
MSVPRQVFEAMKAGAEAHARWDYEMSMSILASKKKMMFLLLMVVPIFLISVADAADMLGSKTAYSPAFYSTNVFIVSIFVGLAAGLITGAIGAGGGFIITPALMAVGVKGILAVGTDLFHIAAKAIMGTAVHKKLGNVSVKLAAAFLVGTFTGTFIGGYINKTLYNISPALSDTFISVVYVLLLGFLGFYALADYLKARRVGDTGGAHGSSSTAINPLSQKIQSIHIPPMITFDEDLGGRQVSGVLLAIGGVFVGTLASIMGVGGGFVTFPMFVYMYGISTMTTVGTDILQIIFTSGVAGVGQYAIHGYVFYTLAMGMLLGSLIGIQVGALTTKVVKGIHIRAFYAITILAGFINRLSVLPSKLNEMGYISVSKDIVGYIEIGGNILFWTAIAIFGVWIFSKFFGNLKVLRSEG